MNKSKENNKLLGRPALCLVTAMATFSLTPSAWAGASLTTFEYPTSIYGVSYNLRLHVNAVSADGSVVVGTLINTPSYKWEPFRWTAEEGVVVLDGLTSDSVLVEGTDISADGSVIIGTDSAYDYQAYRWTAAAGMVGLGDFEGGSFDSWGYAVSANGSAVIGMGTTPYGERPFRWTAATGMHLLDGLDRAVGISADGTVVVGYKYTAYPKDSMAYRWTLGGGSEALGDLPGGEIDSYATAVSTDGSVVVGGSKSGLGEETFYWTQATGMVGLGDLPGGVYESYPSSVSGDGRIIVGRGNGESGSEPMIWSELTGMRSLKELVESEGVDLTNRKLKTAADISQDGSTIVGELEDRSSGSPMPMGYVLRLTDFDHDGYNKSADCDDLAPTVYPNALEIKSDGVDQNCNGYDLTINIKQAVYFSDSQHLVINATSNLGSAANLTVLGFGPMHWDDARQSWNLDIGNVTPAPTKITINGVEGAVVATVFAR